MSSLSSYAALSHTAVSENDAGRFSDSLVTTPIEIVFLSSLSQWYSSETSFKKVSITIMDYFNSITDSNPYLSMNSPSSSFHPSMSGGMPIEVSIAPRDHSGSFASVTLPSSTSPSLSRSSACIVSQCRRERRR